MEALNTNKGLPPSEDCIQSDLCDEPRRRDNKQTMLAGCEVTLLILVGFGQ